MFIYSLMSPLQVWLLVLVRVSWLWTVPHYPLLVWWMRLPEYRPSKYGADLFLIILYYYSVFYFLYRNSYILLLLWIVLYILVYSCTVALYNGCTTCLCFIYTYIFIHTNIWNISNLYLLYSIEVASFWKLLSLVVRYILTYLYLFLY